MVYLGYLKYYNQLSNKCSVTDRIDMPLFYNLFRFRIGTSSGLPKYKAEILK